MMNLRLIALKNFLKAWRTNKMTYEETLFYIARELSRYENDKQDAATTVSHISAYIRGDIK